MRQLSEWNPSVDPHFMQRKVLAFDLDDTLTHKGALDSEIIGYLEKVQAAGLKTVLVTGRSGAWADALLKLLPFDAVLSENGAMIFYWKNGKAPRVEGEEPQRLFWQSTQGYGASLPQGLSERRGEVAKKVLASDARLRVASDQFTRSYDLAIDFAEEVQPPLPLNEATKIQKIMESFGMTAKVSSIHVNGWWGAFSKSSALQKLFEIWNYSLMTDLIYSGDSPNDAPLFEVAGMSVGVANIQEFVEAGIAFSLPTYITGKKSARGSCELMQRVLERSKHA